MTSSKTAGPTEGSTFKAHEAFHQAADRGDYRKAFSVFKAQPHLMNHMTLVEISIHCRMMSEQLAQREVMQFISAVERKMVESVRLLEAAKLYDREVRKERAGAFR